MVHAHNSFYHSLVKKLLPVASSFNVEKLLTTAAYTTKKGKAGEMPKGRRRGWVTFFSERRCLLKNLFSFLKDAF